MPTPDKRDRLPQAPMARSTYEGLKALANARGTFVYRITTIAVDEYLLRHQKELSEGVKMPGKGKGRAK